MRTSRRSSPPPGLCLAALGVALALHACGRSSLDYAGTPGASGAAGKIGGTGSAGSTGRAGSSAGTAGGGGGRGGTIGTNVGTAGAVGSMVGIAGTVGSTVGTGGVVGGTAGVIGGGVGGEFGAAGTKADAGVPDAAPDAIPIIDAPGAPDGVCIDGTSECVGDGVRICQFGGIWSAPFSCPITCFKGVCTECVPGTVDCGVPGAMRVCDANGIWGNAGPPGPECGTAKCVPGETSCGATDSVQTCAKDGTWEQPTPCTYICEGGRCSADPKTVFVTSATFQGGSLGGLAGADAICDKLAAGAGLNGQFRAWLSDDTGSPATRFQKLGGPYRMVNGIEIAANWNQLTMRHLSYAIKVTELGGPAPLANGLCTGAAVWSDTRDDGTAAGDELDCSNWTIPEALGASWGLAGTVERWTEACTSAGVGDASKICGSRAALYCFQQ